MKNAPRELQLFLIVFAIVLGSHATSAHAKEPERSRYDQNGVNLANLFARFVGPTISVGDPSAGGMSFQSTLTESPDGPGVWGHPYDVDLNAVFVYNASAGVAAVTIGSDSEWFVIPALNTTVAAQGNTGGYATIGATTAEYRHKDRRQFIFDLTTQELLSIKHANGEVVDYTYKGVGDDKRLQSVNNNFGYQIKFEYQSNTPGSSGYTDIYRVTAINSAVDYCSPSADTCSDFTVDWPTLTYAKSGGAPSTSTYTITDSLNRVTTINLDYYWITSIISPTGETVSYTRKSSNRSVHQVTRGSDVWEYDTNAFGGVDYNQVVDPDGRFVGAIRIDPDVSKGWITDELDGDYNHIEYSYEAWAPQASFDSWVLSGVNYPNGQVVEYGYDTSGNLTSTTITPPSGTAISTSATYVACTTANYLHCKKPDTTTDGRGKTTNYEYADAHGGLTKTTLPAPTPGADRPETRISYVARQANFKTSATTSGFGSPVYLFESRRVCSKGSGATCVTASVADLTKEIVTETDYGPTSGHSNLQPVTVTSRAGSGGLASTVTFTYDAIGNVTSIDGPLTTSDGLVSGSADAIHIRYDALRRPVGTITPDPDGVGTLKYRAQRKTYRTSSQPELVEIGTVDNVTDATWDATFATYNDGPPSVQTVYDGQARPIKVTLRNKAGTALAVQQVSYNGTGQIVCQTSRLSSSDFASPPAACTQGAGTSGPDVITKREYDTEGRVSAILSGVGTDLEQTTQAISYKASGYGLRKIDTVTDAEGNITAYEYDGFTRPWKVFYPSKGQTTPRTTSSTDYEEYTYDENSNLTGVRLRDGTNVSLSYDSLNRLTVGVTGETLTYDNLGRLLSATKDGITADYEYDARGNMLSEATTGLGAVSYEYDVAGRRKKLSWPDNFHVTYEYDAASQLKTIKENGSAVLAAFDYDNWGRRKTTTLLNGSASTAYSYDDLAALSSQAIDLANTGGDQTVTYTRDALGRVTERAGTNSAYDIATLNSSTVDYTNNGLNQTTVAAGVGLTYDDRGNAVANGSVDYTYDLANRMLTAEDNAIAISYDPVGRLRQYAGTSTTRFLYDGADLIAEYNASGTLLRRYVHGPGTDEPLIWFEGPGNSNIGSGTPDRRALLADERGSIVAVTNGSGVLQAINAYDDYGYPSSSNASYAGRFRYTGQAWLADLGVVGTGLYYYKARMYSPALGRFLQADPIGYGDGMNLYSYVGNDPINRIDPSGTEERCGTSVVFSQAELEASCRADEPVVRGCRGVPEGYTCGYLPVRAETGTTHYGGGGGAGSSGDAYGGGGTAKPQNGQAHAAKMSEEEREKAAEKDYKICRMVNTRACWESAAERDAARASGRPVPPLQTGVKGNWSGRDVAAGLAIVAGVACAIAEPCGAAVAGALTIGSGAILLGN